MLGTFPLIRRGADTGLAPREAAPRLAATGDARATTDRGAAAAKLQELVISRAAMMDSGLLQRMIGVDVGLERLHPGSRKRELRS